MAWLCCEHVARPGLFRFLQVPSMSVAHRRRALFVCRRKKSDGEKARTTRADSKKQEEKMAIIDVVKWDAVPEVFAYKYPKTEFNTKTQLIVAESQEAILVKEGNFFGPFGPGRHTLDTKNYPILTKIVTSLVSGGKSPFTAEVWFVQKAIPLNIKWGTMDPIQVEDPKYHVLLPVRAFGQYGLKVVNSQKFLAKLVGRIPIFTEKTLSSYFRGIIVTRTKDCIGSHLIDKNISVLQISHKLNAISEYLQTVISSELDDYGMNVVSFTVNSITTDDKDPAVSKLKEALAKKAEMDIIGYTYQQERSFDTMKTAAGNPGAAGALMNAGMGLSMGVGIGTPMGNAMGKIAQNLHTEQLMKCPSCGNSIVTGSSFCSYCGNKMLAVNTRKEQNIKCGKCGFISSDEAKFCPNCGNIFNRCPSCGANNQEDSSVCKICGTVMPIKCPNCGEKNIGDVKFCSGCGTALRQKCPECNNLIRKNLKFCSKCGTKL